MAEAKILSGKKFKCSFCSGSGIQPRSLKSRCFACRGQGEVEFESSVITCPSCKGTGRSPGALGLACIRCKGVGVVEKSAAGGEVAEVIGERLGEITKRLQWTRKETEKKTKEIKKRLQPIKLFIKEVSVLVGSALGGKRETQWLEKLANKIKRGWKSLWEQ